MTPWHVAVDPRGFQTGAAERAHEQRCAIYSVLLQETLHPRVHEHQAPSRLLDEPPRSPRLEEVEHERHTADHHIALINRTHARISKRVGRRSSGRSSIYPTPARADGGIHGESATFELDSTADRMDESFGRQPITDEIPGVVILLEGARTKADFAKRLRDSSVTAEGFESLQELW